MPVPPLTPQPTSVPNLIFFEAMSLVEKNPRCFNYKPGFCPLSPPFTGTGLYLLDLRLSIGLHITKTFTDSEPKFKKNEICFWDESGSQRHVLNINVAIYDMHILISDLPMFICTLGSASSEPTKPVS
jgi:hypothetical protein